MRPLFPARQSPLNFPNDVNEFLKCNAVSGGNSACSLIRSIRPLARFNCMTASPFPPPRSKPRRAQRSRRIDPFSVVNENEGPTGSTGVCESLAATSVLDLLRRDSPSRANVSATRKKVATFENVKFSPTDSIRSLHGSGLRALLTEIPLCITFRDPEKPSDMAGLAVRVLLETLLDGAVAVRHLRSAKPRCVARAGTPFLGSSIAVCANALLDPKIQYGHCSLMQLFPFRSSKFFLRDRIAIALGRLWLGYPVDLSLTDLLNLITAAVGCAVLHSWQRARGSRVPTKRRTKESGPADRPSKRRAP